MKKILVGLITALLFIGCSSDKEAEVTVEVTPTLVVGKSLAELKLADQFESEHTIDTSTKQVIFVFSDDMGHLANDYLATKEASYLADNNTQFVADISGAPSLIRSMFIMPGLKDFKHTVLLLTEKEVSAPYRSGIDTEKVVVVSTDNGVISKIDTLATLEELIAVIEAK